MNRNGLMVFVCFVMLSACGKPTFDTADALQAYIHDARHGYLKQKTVNDYQFSLLYRPTDLLVRQALEDDYTKATVDSLRAKYSKYMYFNLSISKNGKEVLSSAPKNRAEFGAMVNRLAFGMHDKVHLFTSQRDTLELTDYVYPRMYGMSHATTMMFVYPRDQDAINSSAVLNVTVEDLDLFTGEVKFKIETEKIKNEPSLKFNI